MQTAAANHHRSCWASRVKCQEKVKTRIELRNLWEKTDAFFRLLSCLPAEIHLLWPAVREFSPFPLPPSCPPLWNQFPFPFTAYCVWLFSQETKLGFEFDRRMIFSLPQDKNLRSTFYRGAISHKLWSIDEHGMLMQQRRQRVRFRVLLFFPSSEDSSNALWLWIQAKILLSSLNSQLTVGRECSQLCGVGYCFWEWWGMCVVRFPFLIDGYNCLLLETVKELMRFW